MNLNHNLERKIITRLEALDFEWTNTDRVSEDWKTKIFSKKKAGYQFALHDTKTLTFTVEKPLQERFGLTLKPTVRKGSAMESACSHFRTGKGFTYTLDSVELIDEILSEYCQ